MTTLVLAEHNGVTLNPATASAVTAAVQLGAPVHLLIAAPEGQALAVAAGQMQGVDQVLLAQAAHYAQPTLENLAALLQMHAAAYTHVIVPATVLGKQVLARLGALLDLAPINEVVRIIDAKTFVRPFHAGNLLATMTTESPQILLGVRPSAFVQAASNATGAAGAACREIEAPAGLALGHLLASPADRPQALDLGRARRIVCGGCGLGSAENFQARLAPLAAALKAGIGATRNAVDAGYAPNESQIGQTGRIVAPELYIGVGLSGAIQHMAGIKEAKTIVAINRDAEAPLCHQADFVLQADLNEAVPQLVSALAMLESD